MNDAIQAGLAVCSGNDVTQINAVYHHVTVSQTTDFSWNGTDIGSPSRSGTSWYADGGTYVISGGLNDGQSQSDQFHLTSVGFSGDGSISAEVSAWSNVQSGDKAGVMFRNDPAADSAFAGVVVSADNTVKFEWRDGSGSGSESIPIDGLDADHPVWVKLGRSGNQFSGYYSLDGSTWIQIGNSQSLELNATVRAGLAVTSHNGANALQRNVPASFPHANCGNQFDQ